jgi:hypothetical protein
MTEPKLFPKAKLICGLIFRDEKVLGPAEERLVGSFGPFDLESPPFAFDCTDYYRIEMGPDLRRKFVSFARLVGPDLLSGAKLRTIALEKELSPDPARRAVNIDPGILTASALIMATAKNFSHRVPLRDGIYAHLEFLFTKSGLRLLDWTYPDFRKPEYQEFFIEVRRRFLDQSKAGRIP